MIAIYTRQSIDKKDSISIEGQIEQCKKEINNNPYTLYSDKGFSGKNTNRPAYEDMMRDVAAGKITKVVVYRLDRISRSITDFATIINILEKYNVAFVSATEKFDTSTPVGKAMLYIIMVFAQLERETIAQRIKDNYYLRGKNGFFGGGNTPYGYKSKRESVHGKQTSVLVEDPEKVHIVQEIFSLYSNTNMSLADVQRNLIAKNIKSTQGGGWDTMKISRILRNPAPVMADADIYTYYSNKGCIIANEPNEFDGTSGCILFGKRDKSANKYTNLDEHVLAIGQHKGFIDSNTFLLCQEKLDGNKQIKNTGKGKYTWLTGLVKCSECGYSMSVYSYNVTKYFKCSGKYNYKVCNADTGTHYVEDIEDYVEELLLDRLVTRKLKEEEAQTDTFEMKQLKLQLLDVENQIEKLLDQMSKSNDVVMDYINKRISKLDLERKELNEELFKAMRRQRAKSVPFDIDEIIAKWNTFDIENKKRVAQEMITKIQIGDKIAIEWKL